MSKRVHEVMNHELLMLRPEETVENALGDLVALGVSAAPIVDAARKPLGVVSWRDLVEAPRGATIGERMTAPAVVIAADATIAHAADVLAERGLHHLFVIDRHGVLVGALSVVDVLRGLIGKPIRHPAAFPHLANHVAWSDDEPFTLSASAAAPSGPGVLLLVESVVGEPDDVAFVEAPTNVRARLLELLSSPPSEQPDLERLLEHPTRLRFRAAAIDDARKRKAVARTIRTRAARELCAAVLR